jgi:hypothetical protein
LTCGHILILIAKCSDLHSKHTFWTFFYFAADFRAEKIEEGLRRKTKNDRRCPIKLRPRILKIVVFGARRRLLHPNFGLGSNATNVLFVALLPSPKLG